jgi:predicted glycosyltransferase/AmiR/NasT family two-component response regulator
MADRRILIVEDESVVRLHLRRIVEGMGHQVVGQAFTAREAVSLAAETDPDLVLMDINLRGEGDGVDAATEISRDLGASVVFATAFADDATIRRTEEAGAVGYIVKPFGEQAVRAALATALREHDRVRAARRESREFAGIVGGLGEAVLKLDPAGRVTYLNPRAWEMAWAEDAEATGLPLESVLHPDEIDRPALEAALARARGSGDETLLPAMTLTLADGREALVSGSFKPLAEGEGFVVSLRNRSRRWFGSGEGAPKGERPDSNRMLIYSHDTFGLGHLRRSLNLASALVERIPNLSVLIVTGSAVAHRFPLPPRVDYVKLPAVRKVAPETYSARSLGVSDGDVLTIRANLLLRVVRDFRPDILLVDHSPAGMLGEMRPALEWVQGHLPDCFCLVGLRDIIDDPEAVMATWRRQGIVGLLEECYDHILVYGRRDFFDPVAAYCLPASLAERVRFLGYVVEEIEVDPAPPGPRPRILVTTGGGDGAVADVAGNFLTMMARPGFRDRYSATVLPGPLAEDAIRHRLEETARASGTEVIEFVGSSSPYMANADLVVCTAGYNTAAQVLRYARRALMIPRVLHRREQLLRATGLATMGLVRCLLPEEADPDRLGLEIADMLADPRDPLREAREAGRIEFTGGAALAEFCCGLLGTASPSTEAAP